MKRSMFTILAALAALSFSPQIARACVMCGLSPGDTMGHAYNTSVLFMLSGPYITFGLIAGIVFFVWRRAKRANNPVVNKN